MPDTAPAWRAVILELLGAWPGRFDEMTATAYVASLQGRGATDPVMVLAMLRGFEGQHPPSASVIAAQAVRRSRALRDREAAMVRIHARLAPELGLGAA